MTDLGDESLVTVFIERTTGCSRERIVYPYPGNKGSPLSLLLDFLRRNLSSQLDLALSYGSHPEFFLLERRDKTIINFDANYLLLIYTILSAQQVEIEGEGGDDATYSALLKFYLSTVEAYLPRRYISRDTLEKLETNIERYQRENPAITIMPHAAAGVSAIEMLKYDEFYCVLWMFFGGHEFGHIMWNKQDFALLDGSDLEDLIVKDTASAVKFIDRQKAAFSPGEVDWYFDDQLYLVNQDDKKKRAQFVQEVFCDQVAVIVVLSMFDVLERHRYCGLKDLGWLADSILQVFSAHIQVSQIVKQADLIGARGTAPVAEIEEAEKNNMARLAFLRDFIARLLPAGRDFRTFKSSPEYAIYGDYGSLGMRDMGRLAMQRKYLIHDALLNHALRIAYDGLLTRT